MRKKTSINVDLDLYRRLGAELTLRGMEYGEWFDAQIRHWLQKPAEIPRRTDEEAEILAGLRRVLEKEKSAMLFFPSLLGVSRETLERFVSGAKKKAKLVHAG